jgi:nucleoside phosphorylase
MRAIIVEDDPCQAEEIEHSLLEVWPHIKVEIRLSEAEFNDDLPAFIAHPPDIFIIDLMIRWTFPENLATSKPPPKVSSEGYYRAGLRCVARLQEDESTRRVPVVLYSALPRTDVAAELTNLPLHVSYLEKDHGDDRLVQLVGSYLAAQMPDEMLYRKSLDLRISSREQRSDERRFSSSVKPSPDLVLITVNEHETREVHQQFEHATGALAVTVSLDNRVYHNLGSLNGSRVFHAISEMGSSAMQQTVDKAIRALNPGAIVAIGIAFGVNQKKQKIGDILVSRQLRIYDLQRIGKAIILRDDKPKASARLIDHFQGFAQTRWKGAEVRAGVILSGSKLIDNLDYRDQLLAFEEEAIGGEMEGAGLYVSSNDHKVDWCVVKSICDWADGHKSRNKSKRQSRAAWSATQFLIQAMQYAPLKST